MKIKTIIYVGGIFFLILFLLFSYFILRKKPNNPVKYEVQFAYAVTSIDPSVYDDWESSFIGNHIYYRLLPEENKPFIPYITNNLSITCENPNSSILTDDCKKVRILFKPNHFLDCKGRKYETKDILKELEAILTKKGGLFLFGEGVMEGKIQSVLLENMFLTSFAECKALFLDLGGLRLEKKIKFMGRVRIVYILI